MSNNWKRCSCFWQLVRLLQDFISFVLLYGQSLIIVGSTIKVQVKVLAIAIVSSTPILEVPGWLDREILPNDPIVVKAENTTALGVVEIIISSVKFISLSVITM